MKKLYMKKKTFTGKTLLFGTRPPPEQQKKHGRFKASIHWGLSLPISGGKLKFRVRDYY